VVVGPCVAQLENEAERVSLVGEPFNNVGRFARTWFTIGDWETCGGSMEEAMLL
jgi:hypothetical protein